MELWRFTLCPERISPLSAESNERIGSIPDSCDSHNPVQIELGWRVNRIEQALPSRPNQLLPSGPLKLRGHRVY